LAVLAALLTVVSTAQAQTFTVLHTFTGGADGAGPVAGLTRDGAGNFYGTTMVGGSDTCSASGCGTVYKLVRHGSSWALNTIYEFTSTNHGPFNPAARIIFGPDGSLYGTTVNGGSCGPYWCGTVYKLQPPASFCRNVMCPWTLTLLHQFAGGDDGAFPYSDLVFDPSGNIYGTTSGDGDSSCMVIRGVSGCGTVFKLTRNADGTWTNHTLYEFQGGSDGGRPVAGVVLDQTGNLYGVTAYGGIGPCNNNFGCGSVFELSPSGSGWVETTLHQFTGGADGGAPFGGLMFDHTGNLYGAASYGGAGLGTVYELTPNQGSWNFNVIYTFTGTQADGPESALTMDAAGNLYGTSVAGGNNQGFGTVYKLTPSASGWSYTSLHDFDLGSDGGLLYGSVALDANGNVFGVTGSGPYPFPDDGVLFEITQ
jgi:uncharacterized repeat protein (TIGR03803 family)